MEEIIYKYLIGLFSSEENELKLALYSDYPAVFFTKAPDDLDENWNDAQFPRCIFDLNMQSDPERKVSGRLFIDVMCENETSSIQPEELESFIKAAVDGCFFSNEEMTISAQWSSSDPFAENDDKLSGFTLTFDVLAYPVQERTNPDPVLAVNLWLKTLYQNAYVIGKDKLPEVWTPTDESPALYCRLSTLGEGRLKSSAAVTWIGADMRVNVMAPSEQVRSTIIKNSIQILDNATRLILNDGSPMLIDKINCNLAADPLREGQIQIKATYGVLNEYTGTPLTHTYVKGMSAESEVS